MHGVAGAAAVAGDEHPAPLAPTPFELGGQPRERGAIQAFDDARKTDPVVAEMLLRGFAFLEAHVDLPVCMAHLHPSQIIGAVLILQDALAIQANELVDGVIYGFLRS